MTDPAGEHVSYFFDAEHLALRDEVRRFAEDEVGPKVEEMEARRKVELALSHEITARGWIGVTIPRRYGGMDLGHLAKTVIVEELARVSGAMGAMAQASQLGVAKVLHFGTERQKARWLPGFASRLMTARLAAYHAAHLLDRRRACDAELMNAKLVNTESALTSARAALEIFAGRGCQREHHIERYLRDVIHTFPAAGTSDVQRLRLAQVAVGEYPSSWSGRLSELERESDRIALAAA
jgi:alkylation response protein AidB-like acyl-CoA dehydrogenase